MSGITLARPLKLDYKPVTRVENYCATGSEAFRNACYAVASRRVRRRDGDRRREAEGLRLLGPQRAPDPRTTARSRTLTAPAMFSPARARPTPRSTASTTDEMKDVLTRIAWKNHDNGALNPRAQFRKEVPKETHLRASPLVAGAARHLRLLGRDRRLGRGDHRAGRGRPPVHRQAALREGAVVRRRHRRRARSTRTTTTRRSPRSSRCGRGRLRAGRHHRPARRAGDGRGARLLHARPSWC